MGAIVAGTGQQQNYYTGKRKDFYVKRGDTFDYDYKHKFVNASGVERYYDFASADSGQMSIKKNKTDTVAVARPLVTLATNTATMFMNASAMLLDPGRYYYDFEIKDASDAQITKLEGTFNVLQDVTEFLATIEIKSLIDMMTSMNYDDQPYFPISSGTVFSSEFYATLIEHISMGSKIELGISTSPESILRGVKWNTGLMLLNSDIVYQNMISVWNIGISLDTTWIWKTTTQEGTIDINY